MRYFTGLDISDNTVFICIVNEEGMIIHETITPTDPKSIILSLQELELPIEAIGMETGPMSNWLAGALKKANRNVVVFDAFKMHKLISMKINKTDKNDARVIAEVTRIDCFSSIVKIDVHVKSPKAQDLKKAIDVRQTLVQARTRLYHAIRGLLKGEGVKLHYVKPQEFCRHVRGSMRSLMPLLISSVHGMLESYAALSKEIDQVTTRLETIAAKNTEAQMLMGLACIGPMTALCFLAVIDDPTRFESSKSVGSYLGLTPTQYSSGKSESQGSISKKGDKTLRTLLFECAVVLLFRSKEKSELKTWGLKKARTIGSRKAIVAVARKLSIRMHQVFLTKKPYVEVKSRPKAKSEYKLTTDQLKQLIEQSQKDGYIQVTGINQLKDRLRKISPSSSNQGKA